MWLIYDTDDGEVAWCRVAGALERGLQGYRGKAPDLVEARLIAGGHAAPTEVLRWLEGAAPGPWGGGGYGSGDESVVHELGSKIRDT